MALSKPETGRIIVGLLALLVNGATNLSFPAILGQAVDKANDADYINQLGNTGLIFAVGSIASWLRIYCLGTSTERISCRLRKALFNCYMDKEIEFFDTQRDGELSIILEKDVPMAAETLTDKLAAGLRSLNSSINGSIMLFATSPELCGVTLTIVSTLIFLIVPITLLLLLLR
jgi:ABC-type multidrug transport system fused ATPase/permease subunit